MNDSKNSDQTVHCIYNDSTESLIDSIKLLWKICANQ